MLNFKVMYGVLFLNLINYAEISRIYLIKYSIQLIGMEKKLLNHYLNEFILR